MANKLPAHLSASLPAHLQNNTEAPMGNDQVTSDDIQIPRIKILHQLSPECEDGGPQHVEGAKAGQYLNTVTNETYDDLMVVNVSFERQFVAFRKRTAGGGLVGTYASEAEAIEDINNNAEEDIDKVDINESIRHALLLLDSDGNVVSPATMDLTGSRLSVSRNWNSNILMKCGDNLDRFAIVWKLGAKRMKNSKGTWHNPTFDFAGYCDESLYAKAKDAYLSFNKPKAH